MTTETTRNRILREFGRRHNMREEVVAEICRLHGMASEKGLYIQCWLELDTKESIRTTSSAPLTGRMQVALCESNTADAFGGLGDFFLWESAKTDIAAVLQETTRLLETRADKPLTS